ncbi:MAG: phage portal protein [Marinagarivorans sp.]|nr:phage portal protein [Marinagarivorans sp.]
MNFFKIFKRASEPQIPTSSVFNLDSFTGDKFEGGFGETSIFQADYWTLRARSAQLFTENMYARGLIRRLVTNIINTGLTPECSPDEQILGLPENSLDDWTEENENRFGLWAKSPRVCDFLGESTFGELQRTILQEAYVCGDVLLVIVPNPETGSPSMRVVDGSSVQTPITSAKIAAGNTITHGVEQNAAGKRVAYWIRQRDSSFKRIAAYGSAGRPLAWLVYGTDKRKDDVRGQPLLSLVLQSLREIDRYRDATQRKAAINALLAMFIKKGENKMGSLPVSGGARAGSKATTTTSNRKISVSSLPEGSVFEELQHGEEPVLLGGQGTDTNFGAFESSIISAIAWAHEVPPEILQLAFSNNYSASQAAINEFKIFINREWSHRGETICSPIFNDWLISEALNRNIKAHGLLDAWRDPRKHAELAAWLSTDWYGSIKPSTDMLKQVKASELLVRGGYSTRARESRVMTGTKFSKNVKRLLRENEMLANVNAPLVEQENPQRQAVASALNVLYDMQNEDDENVASNSVN